MKWIIVYAMAVNGHLQFGEVHDFPTKEACQAENIRLVEKYVADGIRLNDLYGDCYMVEDDRSPLAGSAQPKD